MPTYQYACTACDERLEVVQKFSDDPLTVCTACGGKLRKLFSAVGIVFKGSGFYRTDSRNGTVPAGAATSANGAGSGEASDAGSSSGDSAPRSSSPDKSDKPNKSDKKTPESKQGSGPAAGAKVA